MADHPHRPSWQSDERKLFLRRLRDLHIGEVARFPHDYRVTRREYSFELYQGTERFNLTSVLGGQPIPDREKRIETIVDWIIERIKLMPPTETPANPDSAPAPGRKGGSAHSTAPKATGTISKKAELCLQEIAKWGGEVRLDTLRYPVLTVDKLIVEKLIEPSGSGCVAITPAGLQWIARLNRNPIAPPAPPIPVPEPPPPAPAPPVPVPEPPPPPPVMTITPISVPVSPSFAPACECGTCKSRQLLDLLMTYSPAVREAVEQFQALDSTLERIRGV